MSIYEPELPLIKGVLPLLNGLSKLESCLEAAPHFLLSENEASAMFDQQREAIEGNWDKVCDEAGLSAAGGKSLRLNVTIA